MCQTEDCRSLHQAMVSADGVLQDNLWALSGQISLVCRWACQATYEDAHGDLHYRQMRRVWRVFWQDEKDRDPNYHAYGKGDRSKWDGTWWHQYDPRLS